MAVRYDVTQQAMLQTLIADAERSLLNTLQSGEQADYYNPAQKDVTR
jgi:hypothetical protein